MTVVFVHGVPETPSVWNALRERIDRPGVALRLPGFGSPRPAGLADKEAYAAWLADELRALGGPVDLVGHDWGAHLAMRVVSAYDVPVRSWVSDVPTAGTPTTGGTRRPPSSSRARRARNCSRRCAPGPPTARPSATSCALAE